MKAASRVRYELWQQQKRNDELTCNWQLEQVATKDLAPTPATQGGHVPGVHVPDGALISENEDDFFITDADSESEGDFGGENADDNDVGPEVIIPNEGA